MKIKLSIVICLLIACNCAIAAAVLVAAKTNKSLSNTESKYCYPANKLLNCASIESQNKLAYKLVELNVLIVAKKNIDDYFVPAVPAKNFNAFQNLKQPVRISICTGKPVTLTTNNCAINDKPNPLMREGNKNNNQSNQNPGERAIEKLICNLIILGKPDITSILQ